MSEIRLFDVATQVDYLLMDYGRWDAPSWSPDGKSIAFVLSKANPTTSDTQDDIYTVDVSTGVLHNLTNGVGTNTLPIWSPDGKYIIFVSVRSSNPAQIFRIELDGMTLTQLTNSKGGNEFPIWQPRPKL